MIIEVRGLHKHYEEFHALKGVDLEIEGGRIGLLGPNGAGKTTLIKTLLGLLPYSEGVCRLLDVDVHTDPLAVRPFIGYMPEHDAVMQDLTALDFVTFAAELCGLPGREARGRAHAVLEHCGLGEVRYRRVSSYSTGMRQRVKLAQALVGDPKLLLLDEPTSGLDPQGRDEMLTLIREIPERSGAHLLLSTHILPDVERTCDRVVVMNEGEVLYNGDIETLVHKEENAFEVRVKGNLERYLKVLRTKDFKVSLDGTRILAHDRAEVGEGDAPASRVDAAVERLFRGAAEAEVQVRHLRPLKATLEEAFLETVQHAREANKADAPRKKARASKGAD